MTPTVHSEYHDVSTRGRTAVCRRRGGRQLRGGQRVRAHARGGHHCCHRDLSHACWMCQVLTRHYDPRVIQVGVVSFGPRRCGTRGVPAIYTKVENYISWILDSVNN